MPARSRRRPGATATRADAGRASSARRRRVARLAAVGLAALVALAAAGADTARAQRAVAPAPLQGADLLDALRAGGHVIYVRHADTDHSQNDRRMTSAEDCATQRNLTD